MRSALLPALVMLVLLTPTAEAQWAQSRGPEVGPVTVFSVDPVNGNVFSIANRSAYRSRDGGVTWSALFNGLRGDVAYRAVVSSGSVAYLAGSGPSGTAVFRSLNGGTSWSLRNGVGLPSPGEIRAMAIVGDTVLAGIDDNGVYRSEDGGNTWIPSGSGLPPPVGIGYFVAVGPDLFAGSSSTSPEQGVFRSVDGGATWSPTQATFLAAPAVLVGLSANALGLFAATDQAGIHRTVTAGDAWVKVNADAATDSASALVATASHVYAGVVNGRISRADANGDGWTLVGAGLPPTDPRSSIHALAAVGGAVVAGVGSRGVYRSTDQGAQWTRSNQGMAAARVNAMLALEPLLYAAADDAGFFRTDDDGDLWIELSDGIPDHAGWYALAITGGTLLGGSGQGGLYRSNDGGDHWSPSHAGLSLTRTHVLLVDSLTPSTVYAGGHSGVAKSIDSGASWTTLNTGLAASATVLDLWKSGPVVLAGSDEVILRSADHGDTWTVPIQLPDPAEFTSFAQLGTTVYVGSVFGVYRSEDLGATWTLTGLPEHTLALLALGPDLFAGTDVGLFVSSDGGDVWTPASQGFPANLTVTELAADDVYLFAGTLRNGVWRRPLSELVSTPVLASLVFATADGSGVRVGWRIAPDRRVVVQRRTPSTAWMDLVTRIADAAGDVTIDDPDVTPGGRYGYRLAWPGDETVTAGEVWVDVPQTLRLALHGARPNPARGTPRIALTLPAAGPVVLDLFDVSGRRVSAPRRVDLAAGHHVVPVPEWHGRPPGVYVVRLAFADQHHHARIAVIE